MSSSNNNNNQNDSSSSGGSHRSGSGAQQQQQQQQQQRARVPQNRHPNQQHHSNRIYTRYTDNRQQYRRQQNNHNNNNNNNQQQTKHHPQGGTSVEQSLTTSGRKRLASSMSMGDASKACICCWHEMRTYVFYSCAHVVCLNCSVKLRVLCEKIDCPVCRQESRRVLCTKQNLAAHQMNDTTSEAAATATATATPPSTEFSSQMIEKLIDNIGMGGLLNEPAGAVAAGIYFDSETIRAECADLLGYRCSRCAPHDERFGSMSELEKHMRKAHQRFYCELCVDNLKLFPFERKHYDRETLAQHKRVGDKDDLSFKGHPLCEYCDQRFFDKDTLYRHFRKDHYFCHFCDTDGHEEYYRDYAQLRMHFLKCHYLCEIDGCSANAAHTHEYVVFRTELDFQAHKKQKHAKTKSDAKAYGKLNIEFNFTDSARDRQQQQQQRGGRGRGRGGGGAAAAAAEAATGGYDQDVIEERESRNNRAGGGGNHQNLDANVMRASREQYEADEAERSRQRRLEAMREQHRKYEESIEKQQKPAEEAAKPPVVVEPPPPPPAPTVAAAASASAAAQVTSPVEPPTLWRNLISGGNVPRINKETEFPTLAGGAAGGGDAGSGKFLSLAELGASIGAVTRSNAWGSKPVVEKKPQAAGSSKKPHSPPRLTTALDDFLLPDESKTKDSSSSSSSNKKQQKKQQQTTNDKNKQQQQASPNTDATESSVKKPSEIVNEKPKGRGASSQTAISQTEMTTISSPSLSSLSSAPPPGFESFRPTLVTGPPPGFASPETSFPALKSSSPLSSAATSSSSASPAAKSEFIKPNEYESRNLELKSKLTDLFDKRAFNEFMSLSIEFRNSKITALDYLQKCDALLDFSMPNNTQSSRFLDLVQEMIVLLPSASQQSQLYAAFETCAQKSSSSSGNSKSTNKLTNRLVQCHACEQYFTRDEIQTHKSTHHPYHHESTSSSSGGKKAAEPITKKESNDDDFPALSSLSFASRANLTSAASATSNSSKKAQQKLNEEFPPLGNGLVASASENRYSSMPTPSLFANPSSHLSLASKKKHRLQK